MTEQDQVALKPHYENPIIEDMPSLVYGGDIKNSTTGAVADVWLLDNSRSTDPDIARIASKYETPSIIVVFGGEDILNTASLNVEGTYTVYKNGEESDYKSRGLYEKYFNLGGEHKGIIDAAWFDDGVLYKSLRLLMDKGLLNEDHLLKRIDEHDIAYIKDSEDRARIFEKILQTKEGESKELFELGFRSSERRLAKQGKIAVAGAAD